MTKLIHMTSSRRSDTENIASDRQEAMVIPGTFRHVSHLGLDDNFDYSDNPKALRRRGLYLGRTDARYNRNASMNQIGADHPQYAQLAYADNSKLQPVSSRQVYRQLSRAPTPVDTNILRNVQSNHSDYSIPAHRVLSRRSGIRAKYTSPSETKFKPKSSGQSRTIKRRITLFWRRLTKKKDGRRSEWRSADAYMTLSDGRF